MPPHHEPSGPQANELIDFYSRLLDATSQALIATDASGAVTVWNRRAEELYGWAKQEALGRPVYELTVPETGELEAHEIMTRLARGETWSGDFSVRRRDGSTFLARVWNSPIMDDSGAMAGVIGVSEDVTEERRRAEAEREEQERRSRWLTLTSHELRGSLASVSGYAALLRRRAERSPALDAVREEIDILEAETRRMARTIELLMKVADLDLGRLRVAREPVRLSSLVREVADSVARGEGDARIDVLTPDEEISAESDRDAVQLILRNLIENAIKYGGEPPEVTVQLRAVSGGEATIEVTDNGSGIRAEDRERIFDRYFRAEASPGTPGLGLGLHISHRLATTLGGTLTVESTGENGSTFKLSIPTSEERRAAR